MAADFTKNNDPNYIADEYGQKFNPGKLDDAEKTSATGNENSGVDDINGANAAESKAGGNNWENNVTSKGPGVGKKAGLKNFLKKKGPLGLIGTTIIIGGFGLATIFSPSFLLLHFKEVLANKFDAAHASLEVRTSKMLRNKTVGTGCATGIKILCKYSTFSDKQISQFKEAGITIEGSKKNFLGRTQPESFKYDAGDGKGLTTVSANDFNKVYDSDIKFRSAARKGYNPKFANFADRFFSKAERILKVDKNGSLLDKVDEKEGFDKNLSDVSDDLAEKTKAKPIEIHKSDINPDTGKTYESAIKTEDGKKAWEAAVIQVEANNKQLQELIDAAGGEGASTSSKITQFIDEADKWVGVKGIAMLAFNRVDQSCTVQRTYAAVSLAAKTVRVMQLANYAMMFLTAADMIKAGVAPDNTIAFLGTILTKLSLDEYGNYLSATDSIGYKYAAYGEMGTMKTSSMQFMAGGGVKGTMAKFVDKWIPKSGKISTTCKILGSAWLTLGSLLAGIALTFFQPESGGRIFVSKGLTMTAFKENAAKLLTKDFWVSAAKEAPGILLSLSEIILPNLLKDIVAGSLIDNNTIGEVAGDAVVSGSSGIMGISARSRGNAVLTPKMAVKYDSLKEDIAAREATEDRLVYSPLDITNGNTFMGKFAAWLLPYTTKLASIPNIFTSIASMVTKSFGFLSPQKASAMGVATTTEDSYTQCEDIEYRNKLEIATDPFCNITYGMPGADDSADPIETAKILLDLTYDHNKHLTTVGKDIWVAPQIYLNGAIPGYLEEEYETTEADRTNKAGSTSVFDKFRKNCIDRDLENPIYLSNYNLPSDPDNPGEGEDGGKGGSECIFNDSEGHYKSVEWETGTKNDGTSCGEAPDPYKPPTPELGSVLVKNWSVSEILPNGCTHYVDNYFYIGSAWLYYYYMDLSVESGMEGI